jgi:branched-chain amino acid transport system ATP-binding protein
MVDRPAVLLLDEPASGLDEIEAARLGEQIQRLAQEDRCAVLLVEHDAAFLMAQSDRVVVLDQGAVLTEGTPEAIQNDEAVRDAYLGPAMPRELTPTRPDT